jgi:hypothetical protein
VLFVFTFLSASLHAVAPRGIIADGASPTTAGVARPVAGFATAAGYAADAHCTRASVFNKISRIMRKGDSA